MVPITPLRPISLLHTAFQPGDGIDRQDVERYDLRQMATPSCSGTITGNSSGEPYTLRLNSRMPRVSSSFGASVTRPDHNTLSVISRPPLASRGKDFFSAAGYCRL